VLAVSTDFRATQAHWAKELNATYPLLSDHNGDVAKLYGVLMPNMRLANRVTFVVDKEGKITDIFENQAALDPTGAETACKRLKSK
jgi:peroxiredoxin